MILSLHKGITQILILELHGLYRKLGYAVDHLEWHNVQTSYWNGIPHLLASHS
jgi:hypothetical protein